MYSQYPQKHNKNKAKNHWNKSKEVKDLYNKIFEALKTLQKT